MVIKGTVDIQGLVAIEKDEDSNHFMIDDVNSKKIREVYDYEWTNAKI